MLESDGVETVALSSSLQIAIGTLYYGDWPQGGCWASSGHVATNYVAAIRAGCRLLLRGSHLGLATLRQPDRRRCLARGNVPRR